MDIGSKALSTFCGLHPLTVGMRNPDGTEEAPNAIFRIGAIMLPHDGFDGLGGFVAMPKGHFRKVVVHDVRLDNAMHEVSTNETKFAVDRGSSSSCEGPRRSVVVGQGRVSML